MSTRSGLNPGSMLVTYHQLRTSKPAPTSRTIASANSATTSARRIRRGGRSARDTSATLFSGGTQVAAQRRHRGSQPHQDSRQKRDAEGPAQDARIEAHFIQTRQVARPEGTDEANAD